MAPISRIFQDNVVAVYADSNGAILGVLFRAADMRRRGPLEGTARTVVFDPATNADLTADLARNRQAYTVPSDGVLDKDGQAVTIATAAAPFAAARAVEGLLATYGTDQMPAPPEDAVLGRVIAGTATHDDLIVVVRFMLGLQAVEWFQFMQQ